MPRPTASAHPPGRQAGPLLPALLFALTLTAVAPAFLVGAFARDLMDDLGFQIAELGLVGSMYTVGFGIGALTGRYLWRGWPPDLALFVPGGLALLGGALVARADDLATLVAGVALAGVASSISQTISSHLIASRPTGNVRAATVFSAFQSAKPAAAVVVGLLGVTGLSGVGWREVFLAVGVLNVVLVALVQWSTRDQVYAAEPAGPVITLERWIWRPTVLMSLGFAITSISATFIIEAAKDEGLDTRGAGLVLLGSGCVAVVGRIAAGLLADRSDVSLNRLLAWLFALGGLGCALIATAGITSFLVGVCLVFGPGWAFGGVILSRVSMHDRAKAAQSAGALFLGAALGGALGPAAFGLVVARAGYGVAWAGLGVLMLVAGWVALTWRLGQAEQTGTAHRAVR